MRVIAGTAKRLPLKTVSGNGTRPTTDRIKETLFNMIQDDLYDARFLDLFAGSGGIGIEALSRGAREAVFVEKNKEACSCIRHNLEFTKLASKGTLLSMDVMAALHKLSGKGPFDLIFMDPPYQEGWERQVLAGLTEAGLLHEDTLVIVEAALKTSFDYLEEIGFELIKRKEYKTNAHLFLQLAKGADE
jgi:16S rRNA (guanine966-N2)-methyltransferase